MTKLFALLFLFGCSFLTSVWVMISGWGVKPESWGVITTGWFVIFVLSALSGAIK
jgi:hypothetical protein